MNYSSAFLASVFHNPFVMFLYQGLGFIHVAWVIISLHMIRMFLFVLMMNHDWSDLAIEYPVFNIPYMSGQWKYSFGTFIQFSKTYLALSSFLSKSSTVDHLPFIQKNTLQTQWASAVTRVEYSSAYITIGNSDRTIEIANTVAIVLLRTLFNFFIFFLLYIKQRFLVSLKLLLYRGFFLRNC